MWSSSTRTGIVREQKERAARDEEDLLVVSPGLLKGEVDPTSQGESHNHVAKGTHVVNVRRNALAWLILVDDHLGKKVTTRLPP